MRKLLLTLATVFVAMFAVAQETQEYPVVTSVEELNALPDSTMVEFQNIEVVVVEVDGGYYTYNEYCLPDGETVLGGNVYPFPAKFTAIGFVHNVENWDGTTYREFLIESVVSVSAFNQLGEMINFGFQESNREALLNSPEITIKDGTIVVTHVYNDYIFGYTMVNTGYYTQPVYMVASYPGASEEIVKGDELTGWVSGGKFMGQYTPTYEELNEDWEVVSHKGGCFAIDPTVMLWANNYQAISIQYNTCDFGDFASGYVGEAQTVRMKPGGTIVEKEGKYYYEATYTSNEYVDGSWQDIEKQFSIEVATNYYDLSTRVGVVCEDYIGGVYDYANTGDTDRVLISEFISPVAHHATVYDLVSKGSQYEEEIPSTFDNPLLVTYKYDDGNYKYVLTVADESGAVTLDYSDAIMFDEEGNPTAEYAALQAIQPGDMISGVVGYPQYYLNNVGPKLLCASYSYSTNTVDMTLPTVVSSGNEIKPMATVTVADMINEWKDCQENENVPKIACNVVQVLDVQVVDTLDPWGYPVKYMIQGSDTMELSNLWGEDKMNFQVFERNNIVGIADYCAINGNYIYQFQPLSQEHITDASIVPVVENIADLAEYVGVPVILKNAEIDAVVDGWYVDFKLQDKETYVYGLTARGTYDLKGIYEVTDGSATFVVHGVEKVYNFKTIADLNTYAATFEVVGETFDVSGEAVVTYVDGENVFVQYEAMSEYGSIYSEGNVLMGVKTAVKAGDAITGIRGISTPKDAGYDPNTWEPYFNDGARFAVAEDANITVVSSDNKIAYGETQYLNYIVGYNEGNYSGQALKIFGGGKVLLEDGKYYYEETLVDSKEEGAEAVVTKLEIASNIIDLSTYVDQNISEDQILMGVYNVANTSTEARVFYLSGFMSKYLECNSIADFYALGEVTDYSLVAKFNNPLTVTYVHEGEYSYYLFVQDETGGLRIDKGDAAALAHYKVGDQITGVYGSPQYSWLGMSYLNGFDNNSWPTIDYTYEVVGNVEPSVREVTIPQLNEEGNNAINNGIQATIFISDLVEIKNVKLEECEAADTWGEVMVYPCFVDADGNKLLLPRGDWNGFYTRELTTYELMNVVGIADLAGINSQQMYTIYPRSQEDIIEVIAGVEGVEVNGGIYLNTANQVVANGAVAVVVYDLNGRTVAAANAETVAADALAQGVYVVRATYADGSVATAKVVR